MRFWLTYEGELRSTQRDPQGVQADPLASHKHRIRKIFHRQLKTLWQTNKFLNSHRSRRDEVHLTPAQLLQNVGRLGAPGGIAEEIPLAESLAADFQRNGYRFVPLVHERISLLCSLNILFLRRDYPQGVTSAGDLDNRVKTLIDTLRMPRSGPELKGHEEPAADENPFFCLLEDDDLVTSLSVETGMLLDTANPGQVANDQVKLVISVALTPENIDMFNLNFA